MRSLNELLKSLYKLTRRAQVWRKVWGKVIKGLTVWKIYFAWDIERHCGDEWHSQSQIISTSYVSPHSQCTFSASTNPPHNMRRGKSVIHTKIHSRLSNMDYFLYENINIWMNKWLINKVQFCWNLSLFHWLDK